MNRPDPIKLIKRHRGTNDSNGPEQVRQEGEEGGSGNKLQCQSPC